MCIGAVTGKQSNVKMQKQWQIKIAMLMTLKFGCFFLWITSVRFVPKLFKNFFPNYCNIITYF